MKKTESRLTVKKTFPRVISLSPQLMLLLERYVTAFEKQVANFEQEGKNSQANSVAMASTLQQMLPMVLASLGIKVRPARELPPQ